ncbi:hypothetical protein TGRH88_011430 [Toxoplasma gondii]|uniref:Transmembrane protein n=2 Tax=Toxoplasma gondii TaxID=5811 RepID=A0A0F7V2V7_TOXGV|nr:hypothetical protein TGRH88_011430 [Toxoplasma gondii]CEL75606.1 TPA: hypothetical protein BN1205_086410 [Toxoplasma gondii VEG]
MMKTLALLLQLLSGANLLLHDGHIATVLCSQSPPAAVFTTPVLLQNAPDVEEQVSIHEGPLLSRARDTLRNVWKSRVSKLPRAKLVTVAAVFVAVAAALASWIRRCAGTRSRLATVRESTNLRRLMASGGSGEGPGDGEDDECSAAPETSGLWLFYVFLSQEGKK